MDPAERFPERYADEAKFERYDMAEGDVHDGWAHVEKLKDEGVVVRAPGEVEIPSPGFENDFLSVLADGSDTRGLASLVEYRIGANGGGPPAHWHAGHDEFFYIVSGELGMLADETRSVYGPRSYVFVPRGVTHSFWNPTDEEAVFVSGWTPAGAEQNFLRYHNFLRKQNGEITPEQWAELAAKAATFPS